MFTSLPYDHALLPHILRFVGECNRLSDFCGYPHPGDVRHLISNLLRGRPPEQYVHVHQREDGEWLAVSMIYPNGGYEMMLHPQHRQPDLERALLLWAENHIRGQWAAQREAGAQVKTGLSSTITDCDPLRREHLTALGYQPEETPFLHITMRPLDVPIPEPALPEGFSIRNAQPHEDEALREVHVSAFKSNWQPGQYRTVLDSPAFDVSHEMVVVAPDGRLAAFAVLWPDPVTRCGLFEPVGCAEAYQRRGLTKALMLTGLRRLADEGMTQAMVAHEPDNPAASALYASLGFTRRHVITNCVKTPSEG